MGKRNGAQLKRQMQAPPDYETYQRIKAQQMSIDASSSLHDTEELSEQNTLSPTLLEEGRFRFVSTNGVLPSSSSPNTPDVVQMYSPSELPASDPTPVLDDQSAMSQTSASKQEDCSIAAAPAAKDGVFTKLCAQPEVMVLPPMDEALEDLPPSYESAMNERYRGLESRFFMSGSSNSSMDGGPTIERRQTTMEDGSEYYDSSFSSVLINGSELGDYSVFILYLMVSVFFDWIGFIISFCFAHSHAAMYGSISGLGITVALSSVTVEKASHLEGSIWNKYENAVPGVAFSLAFLGYILFLFGLFAYHRRRLEAHEFLMDNDEDYAASHSFRDNRTAAVSEHEESPNWVIIGMDDDVSVASGSSRFSAALPPIPSHRSLAAGAGAYSTR